MRATMLGYPGYPLPGLLEAIDLTLRLGARVNPAIRCAGVSMNTSRLDEAEALRTIEDAAASLRLPVADPIRGGKAFEALVESCLGHGP
jgi:uncharacterized NAD-dependent epimerase/dehydratase family protein